MKKTISFLTILLAVSLAAQAQTMETVNVMGATMIETPAEENFEILKELYSSEEFKTQQKQGLVSALSSFGDTTAQPENNDAQPTAPKPAAEEAKGDENMLEKFDNIKESGYIKGDENARFTILEYSEALCPYCKRQSDQGTINSVLEEYPTEVNAMFRNFIVHGAAAKL